MLEQRDLSKRIENLKLRIEFFVMETNKQKQSTKQKMIREP